jgi:hypothetical protein
MIEAHDPVQDSHLMVHCLQELAFRPIDRFRTSPRSLQLRLTLFQCMNPDFGFFA